MTKLEKELTIKVKGLEDDCKAYNFTQHTLQEKIKELETENERLKGDLELWESGACRATNLDKCGVVKELEAQIKKMKCCSNCKYFYCPTVSKIEKDGKVLFHNWNKEKQSYCDCGNGEGKKYQLWEIKENDKR